MSKKRNNLGRVKRYNHQYYSKSAIAKKVAFWSIVIALLLVLGYFLAPFIVDLGTSTWYGIIRPPSSSVSPQPETTSTPSPSAQVTATPEPIPASGVVVEGDFATVSLSALTSPELISRTVETLRTQDVTYAVIPLKDVSGYIHYASAVPSAAASVASSTVDVQSITTAMKEAGIIPVASISAYRDPLAVYQDRSMGIQYVGTDYMWLDNTAEAGGKAWMSPYAETSRTFVGDIIAELVDLGFYHFNLSNVVFPSQVSTSQFYGEIGTATRADAIAGSISNWETRFAGQGVVFWYQYPYDMAAVGNSTTGDAPPVTLGVKNIILFAPVTNTDGTLPDLSAIEQITSTLKGQGAENVVLIQGENGTFY